MGWSASLTHLAFVGMRLNFLQLFSKFSVEGDASEMIGGELVWRSDDVQTNYDYCFSNRILRHACSRPSIALLKPGLFCAGGKAIPLAPHVPVCA